MVRKAKRIPNIETGIELAGTAFPAGMQLNPCRCEHEAKQHLNFVEEYCGAEWYAKCTLCGCWAFRQMDNLSYVKWIHKTRKKNKNA